MRCALSFCQLCFGSGLLLLSFAVHDAAAAEAKRVLVVHSFGNAAPPFTTHSLAFETELTGKMGEPVDLDEVYLDVARYATLDMEEALVEFMQKRQAAWHPDLVVPIGSPAGVFVARHRDRLVSETTPVIYAGMDLRRLPPDTLKQNAAFVGESFDLPALVDDIFQLAPATTNIAVVIGASPLELYWTDVLRKEYQPFTNRVSFTWFNNLTFDQMLDQAAHMPPRSFILVVLLMRDAAGVTHDADEALRRMHAIANAPINGIFLHQLGLGIVGGRLYQAELEGIEAARIAVRVLQGESISNFPPQIIGPLRPQYDWRELLRWEIPQNRLPPGSVVKFRGPSAWERYKWKILAAASLCLLEAVLILVLLANLVKRRRAERSLRESEERLNLAVEAGDVGVWSWNISDNHVWATENWRRIFGFPASVALDFEAVLSRIHKDDREMVRRESQRAAKEQTDFAGQFRVLLPDGAQRWIAARGRVENHPDGRPSRMLGASVDITERTQAELTARELSGRLINAQEAERARLARELHDDITQRLARMAIDTAQVERGEAGDARGDILREVRGGLVRLSEDIHALSYRLHPAMLEDLGLVEALRAECERFSRQETVLASVSVRELSAIAPDTALCLFRVAQESLRNVARHARAGKVELTLRALDGGVQLAVQDDGVGFAPALKRGHASLGLASMRERVRLLGGEFVVDSVPGQGTTILAWVPLKKSQA